MSRRVRVRKKLMAEINVVPYIDVMLVLLIIFMITAPLITQGVKVDLPQASSEPVPPSDVPSLIVSVDLDGNYFIDFGENQESPVSEEELLVKVKAVMKYKAQTPILVNGDGGVEYKKVVQLMSLLQRAGVPGVGLLTEPVE